MDTKENEMECTGILRFKKRTSDLLFPTR